MEQPQSQRPAQPKKNIDRRSAAWMLMSAGMEFAAYIAAPLLFFLLLIEPKFNPGHKSKAFMVVGLLICLGLSSLMVGQTINSFRKKFKD